MSAPLTQFAYPHTPLCFAQTGRLRNLLFGMAPPTSILSPTSQRSAGIRVPSNTAKTAPTSPTPRPRG
ncbi:hypothetical protein BC936DRAFT_137742 [Jimgerdemannia flammicorona]|uniref:Uncharacterized protein n=1 Tax=Jimgerdemannia flammicorona TaxID=994334 RepID=A0A433DND0_9FUNG|nr:hypothetical protein BC936DRAFT_137742 [Jimgerdemannia flammicorona]